MKRSKDKSVLERAILIANKFQIRRSRNFATIRISFVSRIEPCIRKNGP